MMLVITEDAFYDIFDCKTKGNGTHYINTSTHFILCYKQCKGVWIRIIKGKGHLLVVDSTNGTGLLQSCPSLFFAMTWVESPWKSMKGGELLKDFQHPPKILQSSRDSPEVA